MKLTSCVVLAALLSVAAATAQPPVTGRQGLTASIQRDYEAIKRNLKEAAEKVKEEDYNFRPTPEIRSYGQLFGHTANSQFNRCSALRGEANPNQGNDNEKKTTKAEFVKALNDSFAFCDPAYASLTDETAVQFFKQGGGELVRAYALMSNVVHDNEMYGTASVYMRLKGYVPPSTERQMQSKRP